MLPTVQILAAIKYTHVNICQEILTKQSDSTLLSAQKLCHYLFRILLKIILGIKILCEESRDSSVDTAMGCGLDGRG
jgi:hypothetical protein